MGNVIDLKKKAGIVLEKKNLSNVQANIVHAIDISISMRQLYSSGVVQNTVERLLGLAMNMDTDKSVDVFAFGSRDYEIGAVTEGNHEGFVNNVLLNRVNLEGSTNYAGVMNRIVNKYGQPISAASAPVKEEKKGFLSKLFGSKEEAKPEAKPQVTASSAPTTPTFVFFITDGDNFDKNEAERIVREAAGQPIFWQFIGLGNSSFSFLERLDDLQGRIVDNPDFFSIKDIATMSDNDLYERLLNEFPGWLKEVKAKGILG